MDTTSKHCFDSAETVSIYDRSTGGGGLRIASSTLDVYEQSSPIKDGDRFLDNACGTGIVTRVILARAGSKDIHIDAADLSEPMLNAFKGILTGIEGGDKVTVQVMDAQVRLTNVPHLRCLRTWQSSWYLSILVYSRHS